MPWVQVIPAEEADGELKQAYERVGVTQGSIGQPFDGLTSNGPVLLKLMEFSHAARFGPSALTRLQREMIATYVSALNHCVF
jgi:alkylhydroperoxidase family enzyme